VSAREVAQTRKIGTGFRRFLLVELVYTVEKYAKKVNEELARNSGANLQKKWEI
jgi:hypothetical protein